MECIINDHHFAVVPVAWELYLVTENGKMYERVVDISKTGRSLEVGKMIMLHEPNSLDEFRWLVTKEFLYNIVIITPYTWHPPIIIPYQERHEVVDCYWKLRFLVRRGLPVEIAIFIVSIQYTPDEAAPMLL